MNYWFDPNTQWGGLPVNEKDVLCFNRHEGKFIAHYHEGSKRWRHWGVDGFGSPGWVYREVSRWRPLPEDPED